MLWKKLVPASILTLLAVGLIAAGIAGILLSNKTKTDGIKADEPIKEKRKHNGEPATCDELKPVTGLRLQKLTGLWVLQEKLEFPDGMTHHNVLPSRDQTSVCIRTQVTEANDIHAMLKTDLFKDQKLIKNYTGFIKVKIDTGHWNFHLISKDHDGIPVLSEPSRYFVFTECVKDSKTGSFNTPGSVFVMTKGNLHKNDMEFIRISMENMYRRNDETFLDFGAYCY